MTDETTAEDKPGTQAEIPVEVEGAVKDQEEGGGPGDKLAALEKDKKELHERLLRTAADFDNFRKRSRKDVDEARAKAREDVLREILPVADNLERALAAADSTVGGAAASGIADGVKLVLRQFSSALDRFEVKSFPSLGEAFDPARHEAISQIETADKPAGTIVVEMQKGYLMGTRLIRPAMVAVARAPAPVAVPAAPDEPAAAAATETPDPGQDKPGGES